MGISAGGSSDKKSDINVTPLVDVVLVLLIIFLVTMPVLMKQVTIEVPRKIRDDESTAIASKQITIMVKSAGTVIVNDGGTETEIPRVELAKTLRPILEKQRTEKVVFVDFDNDLPYGEVVSAMDTLVGIGASATDKYEVKVALKTREDGAE